LQIEIREEKPMSTEAMTKIIADYFKTQPVLKAWLFGSFARGEETPLSDVDILVEFDHGRPIGLLRYAGMWREIEDLIGRKVDLVENGTLMPFAAESANRDKQLIYERTE
jgi:predicted nucleotidyltransferase